MRRPRLALVADEDSESQARLIDLLEEGGWHVISCMTAVEAVEEAAWYRPSVAFIDSRLTRDYGVDLIRPIKEVSSATRIVLTDFDADWEKYMRVIEEGGQDLVLKPVSALDVSRLIA